MRVMDLRKAGTVGDGSEGKKMRLHLIVCDRCHRFTESQELPNGWLKIAQERKRVTPAQAQDVSCDTSENALSFFGMIMPRYSLGDPGKLSEYCPTCADVLVKELSTFAAVTK